MPAATRLNERGTYPQNKRKVLEGIRYMLGWLEDLPEQLAQDALDGVPQEHRDKPQVKRSIRGLLEDLNGRKEALRELERLVEKDQFTRARWQDLLDSDYFTDGQRWLPQFMELESNLIRLVELRSPTPELPGDETDGRKRKVKKARAKGTAKPKGSRR